MPKITEARGDGARGTRGQPRAVAAAGVFALLAGGTLVLATPAHAAQLDNVSLAVSSNVVNATGVTYTWNFTTVTLETPTSLTFTVPAGTPTATLTVGAAGSAVYGLAGCQGHTAALSGTTVTVSMSSCASLPAGTPVSVAISGFTNTNTAVDDFASVVTVNASADTGNAPTVDFTSDSTGVTVVIPQSLTFINDTSAITLLPIPGATTPPTAPVKLTVSTNASGGYTLKGCVTAPITGPASATIPQAPTAQPLDGSTTHFGARAAIAPGTSGNSGVGSLFGGWLTTGTDYLGYAADCDAGVISKNTGTTTGDVLTLTNAVSATAIQPAGEYTGTITYQVVPSY